MAGTSKHYILRDEGKLTYDYTIPARMIELFAQYAPAFGGSVAQGRERRRRELVAIYEALPNWRKRILAMWKLRPEPLRHACVLTEYLVRPGRSVRNCPFRDNIRKIRAFKKRPQTKKLTFQRPAPMPVEEVRFPWAEVEVAHAPAAPNLRRFFVGEAHEMPPPPPQRVPDDNNNELARLRDANRVHQAEEARREREEAADRMRGIMEQIQREQRAVLQVPENPPALRRVAHGRR